MTWDFNKWDFDEFQNNQTVIKYIIYSFSEWSVGVRYAN